MKQGIDLRPVYHRRGECIRAHVTLCWLALLLARIAEDACKQTWPELRRDLDRIHVGTFQLGTEFSKRQRDILKALEIEAPSGIYQLKLPAKP
jgi:hypothetical protein